MEDTADFDGVSSNDKQEPVIGDAEPEFISALECLHVTLACLSKALQSSEDAHGRGLVKAANICLGRFSPDNPRHRSLL